MYEKKVKNKMFKSLGHLPTLGKYSITHPVGLDMLHGLILKKLEF